MTLVTIIGRGHSGTRAIAQTLSASGVFMGTPLNESGDLLPPEAMYEACRVLARYVQWRGGMEWDWSALYRIEIPAEFTSLIHTYLRSVWESTAEYKGWKIPETTLVFPWIAHMFPEIRYIFWIRNPRDCILGVHLTDNLNDFGIQHSATEDEQLRRAISWKYQHDLVKATPKPEHWLEDFLGIKLVKIPVQPESVGRWKLDQGINYYDFFEPAMLEYDYEVPLKV